MIKHIKNTAYPLILAAALAGSAGSASAAGDVDFSCMSQRVWNKGHVSNQFDNFDIVLKNDCPGPVYWTMCIERLHPWNGKLLETLEPAGYVEAGKKARVNIHMKKGSGKPRFRNRFQEFNLNVGYDIDSRADVTCHASRCEAKKSALRAQSRSNEAAWKAAAKSLAARISSECPNTGWDSDEQKKCEAQVREGSRTDMQHFVLQDQEIREKLAAIDPEHCQVYSGSLVND